MLLCDSCMELWCLCLLPSSVALRSASPGSAPNSTARIAITSTGRTKGQGRLTGNICKDLRMHKLIFEEDVLPDGTALAYYARGEKLLEGYKKGVESIAFAVTVRSAPHSLKHMLDGLHVANSDVQVLRFYETIKRLNKRVMNNCLLILHCLSNISFPRELRALEVALLSCLLARELQAILHIRVNNMMFINYCYKNNVRFHYVNICAHSPCTAQGLPSLIINIYYSP